MRSLSKKIICLTLLLINSACTSTSRVKRSKRDKERVEQTRPSKGSPNPKGFIPLAPPVIVNS